MQIFLLQLIDDTHAFLNPQESKHCIKVLRHTLGDQIHCIDGKGTMFLCEISGADIQEVQLTILSTETGWGEKPQKLILALSPLRLKDRFEWALEKAVELGVDEIYPMICQRTDKYKSKIKVGRLETLILAAVKQNKRSRIPLLHDPMSFQEAMSSFKRPCYMGYCEAQTPVSSYAEEMRDASAATLLIGPEGDFTEEEVAFAQQKGAKTISLGTNRLRTETAAVYTLSVCKFLWEY